MTKKLLLALMITILMPTIFYGEETQGMAVDYVTRIQNEISADISKLRASLEIELEGMKLDSTDIAQRTQELEKLSERASDDMAAWEYTPEQRQLHTHILSELITAYSAYGALLQSPSTNSAASDDVSMLGNVSSPDINESDALRQEIAKVSRGLDVQVFYLQSKISKLRLDLAEASSLQKQLKAAQEGGDALELPHTHVLSLENARINAALTRLQVRAQKAAFDSNVTAILRLRRRLADMKGKVSFPKELLDANIEALQAKIAALTEEMSDARKSLNSANSALKRARASLTSADANAITASTASYMARSARVSYWEYMTAMINEEISLTREAQEVWRKRYKLFHDEASGEDIWAYREEAEARQQELQKQLDSIRAMENVVFREIDTLQSQANAEGVSGLTQQNLMQAAENRRRIISEVFNRYETMIPRAVFYQQRLHSEANDNLGAIRLAEKVSSFSKETIMSFLNTELWQGEGYSVTVSKLTIAVAVLLSSFFLSSWGSKWIKRRIMKRAKASITAANAIQRITFYILWITFALIALNIVDIPLTAFAFMGGAMAVGIGFGMQNIFNNLISGFIVIFSRPFKVNDIVEVAGTQGVVEDIGSRSTTIKTWDGLDVVLPNRYFLENSVTNWTGTDLKKREILKVSVSYEADTREVEKILLDVVGGHSQVLKNPAPFVIFKDFGNDGLEFEIYYWFELRKGSGAKISSDMRHHITAVFRREGIDIPYPQRVIHMAETPKEESVGENDLA
ncbi:MAG: mechanosensitive ion channel [Synergistaceae bacterium]|nr:mechanosensitive ion channel [Synergistaceae bacterium]MBQ3397606.1 mechanosensitive ion channel [Synergistaceae bacterium]MBQ3757950.1 mechanosensitive ion channel [Synergistaceae bacterium]MBQ6115427.1 mechanosensitive ion channel [Synergistaceae bacterium]MBQ6418401.1 mechanosensitive ion channel [Synergistaceae bacterium]